MDMVALAVVSNTDGENVVRVYSSTGTQCERRVQVAGPKRPIKFAVGSPGNRSGLRRVWSLRDKDDVYVMPLSIEGFTKISLHESGDWRHQVLYERMTHPNLHFVQMPDPTSRVLEQWSQPSPTAEGWTDALAILVPSEDVIPVPDDHHKPKDVQHWASKAPQGQISEFRISLVSESAPALMTGWEDWRTNPLTIVGAYRTSNGLTVLVTHHRTKMTSSQRQVIERLRAEMSQNLPADFDTSARSGPRMIGSATDPEGCHIYLDLALFPMQ